MQVELMYQHAYTLGRVHLAGGEKVRVEAASMVGMSSGTTLEMGIELNSKWGGSKSLSSSNSS